MLNPSLGIAPSSFLIHGQMDLIPLFPMECSEIPEPPPKEVLYLEHPHPNGRFQSLGLKSWKGIEIQVDWGSSMASSHPPPRHSQPFPAPGCAVLGLKAPVWGQIHSFLGSIKRPRHSRHSQAHLSSHSDGIPGFPGLVSGPLGDPFGSGAPAERNLGSPKSNGKSANKGEKAKVGEGNCWELAPFGWNFAWNSAIPPF